MIDARTFKWITAAIACGVALLPLLLSSFGVGMMNDIGIGALVALGLILLTGVGGVTSFGQAAFVGIAAYSTAWLTTSMQLSPWIGLLFALVLTGTAALIIGALTLRLGGHFLPISTIAWGLSVPIVFSNMDAFGRHTGISNIAPVHFLDFSLGTPEAMYYLIWLCVALAYVFSKNLLDSREGRALRSLRGGSSLLASVGADSNTLRLRLFVFAALLAGLAGWLYAHNNRYVSPSPFEVKASIDFLLMAVMGGLGQLAGALIGAVIVILMKNYLQDLLPWITDRGAQLEIIVFSLIFLLLLHRARSGFCGFILKKFGHKIKTTMPPVTDVHTPLETRQQPVPGTRVLAVREATKKFGGLVAVNDVSFDVNAGEIVGLIGPNGAGKSTMFNLVTGVTPLTSGTVHFMGDDVTSLSQKTIARRGIGRTFQHVKLRPNMTLLDNVALGAYARTKAGIVSACISSDRDEEAKIYHEARIQLGRIGLADREHELAGALPLGTQRMLEIARALMSDPLLLILDEPAAGLRHAEKQELGELLRQLKQQGVTILIVEHDMDFVMKLVDRLVVMNFGCKLMEGKPAEVRRDPQVQAAYLGGTV
jgi:branched-chain amino acid transport system permease protein